MFYLILSYVLKLFSFLHNRRVIIFYFEMRGNIDVIFRVGDTAVDTEPNTIAEWRLTLGVGL